MNTFADATGDHQWIHIDVERAKAESPFGGPIAHGYLTLSLIVPLCSRAARRLSDAKMGVNYGLNKVRFPAPVPVGSKVRPADAQGRRGGRRRAAEHLRRHHRGARAATSRSASPSRSPASTADQETRLPSARLTRDDLSCQRPRVRSAATQEDPRARPGRRRVAGDVAHGPARMGRRARGRLRAGHGALRRAPRPGRRPVAAARGRAAGRGRAPARRQHPRRLLHGALPP